MTIANIATDDDLLILSVSSKTLDILEEKMKDFANQLDDSCFKRNNISIDESNVKVDIIVLNDGWDLVECIDTLYKFAINDEIKRILNKKVKDFLNTIIYKGNEVEKEYSFKLLNQLCFEKETALDIKSDSKLTFFFSQKSLKKCLKIYLNHLRLISQKNHKGGPL
jgi:hypothetical protein